MCLRTILHSEDLGRAEVLGPEFASLPRNRSELFAGILKRRKRKKKKEVSLLSRVCLDFGRHFGGLQHECPLDRDSSETAKLTGISPLKWKVHQMKETVEKTVCIENGKRENRRDILPETFK